MDHAGLELHHHHHHLLGSIPRCTLKLGKPQMPPPRYQEADARRPGLQRETSGQEHPSFTTTDEAYAEGLYRSEVKDEHVERCLEEATCYRITEKRWAIPEMPTTRADLVSSVLGIIRSVVGMFTKTTQEGVEREVVEMCRYDEGPALVVRAAGPSFEIPKPRNPGCSLAPDIGYSNVATYFSVKLERDIGGEKKCLEEMAVYARWVPPASRLDVRLIRLLTGESFASSPTGFTSDPWSSQKRMSDSYNLIEQALRSPLPSMSTSIPAPSFDFSQA